MKNRSLEASQKRMTVLTYTALILGALIMVFPFVWMILTSLKTVPESMQVPPTILPKEMIVSNFGDAMKSLPFLKLYLNTALMIFFRVICAVAFSSMAGYAFAMLEFRGKKLLFGIVLVQMSLPSQIFIIPQYQMVAKMGLANTIFALVFPGIVSAFGVFFLRQTYMGIPKEIGEAAYLDGCNQWQTFYKIMFPLTGTSVAALTIFTAVFAYSDLMWPLVVNSDLNMMTLSSGLATLRGQFTTNFPVLMAGSLLAMLPMVILYLIFQKQFIEGIASTGGK
ncbi:carbohydrate ABC transporter permease [uncultured Oscillibacter sp.]|jgi:multiple sugar transport system permease protein|uniref:carbohydrate ABC transporter permease n=1 Tax=uncultured Oscillibacter sp. TaxID=876091 RepID=UPI002172B430|nr:carbohydrate ABC transporter permease [uncultured Oscillibacter sp.]MCI9553772.1 carbohydrate ABC transporter permease [Oscillibacter sp.]